MGEYGYRESASPHIGLLWWAGVDEDADYVDAANEFWGLAFGVLADGRPAATLIGPSLAPRELHLRAGERGWGVELAAHVFVRQSSKQQLLGLLGVYSDPATQVHSYPDGSYRHFFGVVFTARAQERRAPATEKRSRWRSSTSATSRSLSSSQTSPS